MKEYTTNSKTSGVLGQRHLKGTLKGDATLCLKGTLPFGLKGTLPFISPI